ncbi:MULTISPECIES: YitT family protein [unclassified Mycoplasma]|uniref:YitT family protein n=1 Tax=unclassified Mycoplasma TaxID=2683645 RepID=UPI00211BEBA9|nr:MULTISPECIES: YitT family protein [unclassified Mycoplasma]UUM20021.1 YitT family protein [Mycoplasma sp. 1578d]UUM25002.1 YitT family protein [Mycoplasma sp. 3686d]
MNNFTHKKQASISPDLPSDYKVNNNEKSQCNLSLLDYKMGEYLIAHQTVKLTLDVIFKRYWWRVLLVLASAFLFNFAIQIFLSRGDTVPSGWTGIPTLLQILIKQLRPYFALIFLAVNIPLFVIFWKKVKKSFIYLTLTFMILQILANLIFTQPVIYEFITSIINLVPDDLDINTLYNADHTAFHSNISEAISHLGIVSDNPKVSGAYFIKPEHLQNWINNHYNDKVALLKIQWYNEGRTWPFLLYCALGAFFVGIAVSLAWKAGGSTGGTDIIAYYFVTKRKSSIGGLLSLFGIITASIFLLIWGFVQPNIAAKNQKYTTIFGIRELSTFTYILISNIVISIIYPKYKKLKLVIVSDQMDKIVQYFNTIHYWHSYQIVDFKSGYDGKMKFKVETVVLLFESKNLISDLKSIDPKAWISLIPVGNVVGNFDTRYVEQ